jgi:hypothetical protein
MLFYQFISTTAVLEQLIHDLATSIEGKPAGNNQTSSEGGIMFVYDKSPESTALSREYITKLVGEDILNLQKSADISKWPSLQQTIPDVRLSEPTRRPVLLRRIKGPIPGRHRHLALSGVFLGTRYTRTSRYISSRPPYVEYSSRYWWRKVPDVGSSCNLD